VVPVKKLFAPLLAAVLSLSCAPLYVDSPALTVAVLSRLTHEATVGPIPDPGVYLSDPWLTFHPDIQDPTVGANHGIDPARGFITWSTPSLSQGNTFDHSVHLAYVVPGATGDGAYTSIELWSGPETGWDSVPVYQFYPVKAGPSTAMPYVAVITLDDGTGKATPVSEVVYSIDTANGLFTALPSNTFTDINSYVGSQVGLVPGYALGFCREPYFFPDSDRGFWKK
jgi:hypothetical protein